MVNQGDNKLLEIAPSADGGEWHIAGTRILDTTKVVKGVGAALFGLAATTDAAGSLEVYFTNDNTNTVNLLSAKPGENESEENNQ